MQYMRANASTSKKSAVPRRSSRKSRWCVRSASASFRMNSNVSGKPPADQRGTQAKRTLTCTCPHTRDTRTDSECKLSIMPFKHARRHVKHAQAHHMRWTVHMHAYTHSYVR